MKLPALYAIVDQHATECCGWTVPALARAFLAGGARLIQLRAPSAGSGQLLAWCDELVAAARPLGARVIVNDRADIARLAGAGGVHVGQTDLAPSDVRRQLPAGAAVGISTHSPGEVDRSVQEPVSYVAVGPVYSTATKCTGRDPVGLELVRYAARAQARPVVAIGGITLERATEVLAAGASAVAVVADLLRGNDPVRRARAYAELLAADPK